MENGGGPRTKREPKWIAPQPSTPEPQLKLYNSLTRRNDVFIPREGRKVSWYICGPTVYDSAHMGHARAYISFDILRRILHSYFNYDIKFVMNVTDIDDKIIKRARQTYLIDKYMDPSSLSGKKYTQIIDDMMEALRLFGDKWKAETNEDKKKMYQTLATKVGAAVTDLEAALKAQDADKMMLAKARLLAEGRDVLSDWLDQRHGADCTDHSIFNKLSREHEEDFHKDMASLNVLPADVLTRVSEFVPEIIRFIEKIIANGYAYEANGSVYFDTEKFDANPRHHYAKLVPEAFDVDLSKQQDCLREGEGELSVGEERLKEKRGPNDFALWKASKAGEPFWDSPWGQGRPGWHIECSVMASEICGEHLDIHAGGFDLKFPHHDNEIAQTEAHFCIDQWVNYFLHAGTLRIAGMKMSKSLKNFITIKQALQQYTARQIRLLFLLHNWSECLDYSTSTMERALQFEKITNEFFLVVKHYLRTHFNPKAADSYVKFGESECQLDERFALVKQQVHSALCDNVDTRSAMESIRDLISQANVYIARTEAEKRVPNCLLLRNIATYVTRLFRIFGAVPESSEIGFADQSSEGSGQSKEEEVMPYLTTLAQFREKIRSIAIATKNKEILEECDVLRDSTLPELGVRMEDKEGHTVIKLADRETLMREREQKERLAAEKKAEMEKKKAEAAAKEALKRMPPTEMFRSRKDEFSAWDEKGIPTHDIKGAEISKGQRKKLEKLWETQDKKFKSEQNGHEPHVNGAER